MSAPLNALSGKPVAGYSQSLKHEITDLLARHGKEAVAAEVAAQTRNKRGPKSKPDLLAMRSVFKDDAWDLLEGRNPFRLRTNYMLARKFANGIRGQSPDATIERLEKKLRAQRRKAAYFEAYMLTVANEVPHEVELCIIKELDKLNGGDTSRLAHLPEKIIANYRERVGNPPPEWSIRKILDELPRPVTHASVFGAALLAAATDK